jgi:hypothetical protein
MVIVKVMAAVQDKTGWKSHEEDWRCPHALARQFRVRRQTKLLLIDILRVFHVQK